MKNKVIMRAMFMVSLLASLFVLSGCGDVISSSVPETMEGEGTVLFIVYDNSGSMSDKVINSQGNHEEKCVVADRALIAVGKKFDTYLSINSARTLGVGIVVVQGGRPYFESFEILKGGVEQHFKNWTRNKKKPSGGTPLGNGMRLASENMIGIKDVANKHIVILTDGLSNSGVTPISILPIIKNNFKKVGIDVGVHLVAFDINEEYFDSLKKGGATVLGAKNEVQLNETFDTILSTKIMLERAE